MRRGTWVILLVTAGVVAGGCGGRRGQPIEQSGASQAPEGWQEWPPEREGEGPGGPAPGGQPPLGPQLGTNGADGAGTDGTGTDGTAEEDRALDEAREWAADADDAARNAAANAAAAQEAARAAAAQAAAAKEASTEAARAAGVETTGPEAPEMATQIPGVERADADRQRVDEALAGLATRIDEVRVSQDLRHHDLGSAFQHLADAMVALSAAENVRAPVTRMLDFSRQITESDPMSPDHTDWARLALQQGAEALTALVGDVGAADMATRLTTIRATIDTIDVDRPLLRQTQPVADALYQMGGVIAELNRAPEAVGAR
ncbi:MAG: hypothetical protein V4850_32515 [Myxococcota bacterium]